MFTQSQYNFSLHVLKTRLIRAGGSKQTMQEKLASNDDIFPAETLLLFETTCNNMFPKMVADDVVILGAVLREVFPGASMFQMGDKNCEVKAYLRREHFMQKILLLQHLLEVRHGVMLVGPSGVRKRSGKW